MKKAQLFASLSSHAMTLCLGSSCGTTVFQQYAIETGGESNQECDSLMSYGKASEFCDSKKFRGTVDVFRSCLGMPPRQYSGIEAVAEFEESDRLVETPNNSTPASTVSASEPPPPSYEPAMNPPLDNLIDKDPVAPRHSKLRAALAGLGSRPRATVKKAPFEKGEKDPVAARQNVLRSTLPRRQQTTSRSLTSNEPIYQGF